MLTSLLPQQWHSYSKLQPKQIFFSIQLLLRMLHQYTLIEQSIIPIKAISRFRLCLTFLPACFTGQAAIQAYIHTYVYFLGFFS